MKLVELLARDLDSWPDSYDGGETYAVTQDYGGELSTLDRGREANPSQFNSYVWDSSMWTLYRICLEQADDYSTAIVTQEEWRAARLGKV